MITRRNFAVGATGALLGISQIRGRLALAQSDAEEIESVVVPEEAYSTNPGNVEVGWVSYWNRVTRDMFAPIPGVLDTVVLRQSKQDIQGPMSVIIKVEVPSGPVDPQEHIDAYADTYPEDELGYAPGTTIRSRSVTEYGAWAAYGADEPQAVGSVGGLILCYTPAAVGDPLITVIISLMAKSLQVNALKQIDFGISLNGLRLCHIAPYEQLFEPLKAIV